MTEAKKTALYNQHLALGGKLVDFAGWTLPVRYSEIITEHLSVRKHAGLFDVSHMGEIEIVGPEALQAVNYLTSNDAGKLYPGKAQYSCFLNESGGVVDDIIVYCFSSERYILVVNAANLDKDYSWLLDHNKFNVAINDLSSSYAQLALQGSQAKNVVTELFGEVAAQIEKFHFVELSFEAATVMVARTGYTGEDGFEFYLAPDFAEALWLKILQVGAKYEVRPCGLGARDTLRIEAAYPLYGHELSNEYLALESGLAWIVKFSKDEFIGKEALLAQKQAGVSRLLAGLKLLESGSGLVREGALLFDEEGLQVGLVTSGTKTPSLDYAIAMALIDLPFNRVGTRLWADVRGRKIACKVVRMPFISGSL